MSPNYEARMLRVLKYINEHPDADMSLDTLADIAAMSRFHWHRVFHAMTGETCAQAVRRVRMNRAACLLVQSDLSVAAVAKRVGYPSVQSFGRSFRLAYGASPVQFRKTGAADAPQLLKAKGSPVQFDVTIEEASQMRLAALSHTGPYMEIGSAFERLGAIATSRNLWPNTRGMVGVYLDDPDATPEAELRSYAGLALADGVALPEGLEEFILTPGPIARLRHKGPYSGLKAAYGYLYGDWLVNSGREPADRPPYEVYLNSVVDTAPADLLTDICLPLR